MPVKRPGSAGEKRCLLSQIKTKISSPFIVLAEIQLSGKRSIAVSTFIDSGANTEFIDCQFALSFGIELIKTNKTHKVLALDGHYLNDSCLEATPVTVARGEPQGVYQIYCYQLTAASHYSWGLLAL